MGQSLERAPPLRLGLTSSCWRRGDPVYLWRRIVNVCSRMRQTARNMRAPPPFLHASITYVAPLASTLLQGVKCQSRFIPALLLLSPVMLTIFRPRLVNAWFVLPAARKCSTIATFLPSP